MNYIPKRRGFSLLEIMLVLVILISLGTLAISTLRVKSTHFRLERTAEHIQNIMQASVSYYVDHHAWPGDTTFSDKGIIMLAQNSYIPEAMLDENHQFISPFGEPYQTSLSEAVNGDINSVGRSLLIRVSVGDADYANVLQGLLPLAYIDSNDNTAVIASVNVPSYNYNHAQSVNAMGIYAPDDCVPVPPCPTGMKPHITTAVTGVAGTTSAASPTSYPIQNFMASATGPDSPPPSCVTGKTPTSCESTQSYFRVCLFGITSQGKIVDYVNNGNHTLQILAMTNCS